MKTNLKIVLLLIATTFYLLSCEVEQNDYYYNYPESAFGIIANASPSSGDLFFYADDNRINNSGLNYSQYLGYRQFYTGDRNFTLRNSNGIILASTNIQLSYGDYFSVFAVNNFNEIELVSYTDNLSRPSSNKAKVRFINLSPDMPAIEIFNGINLLQSNLNFKDASNFVEIESGEQQIIIKTSNTGTEVLNTNIDFKPGIIYTIYTKGYDIPPSNSNDTFSIEKIIHI